MTVWADLLPEIASLILSKLFGQDKYRFSLVCKSWNASSAISPYRHSPYLVFYKWKSCEWEFIQHNLVFSKEFPTLPKSPYIRCSKYGWLLMSGDPLSLFFFNPFNGARISLPDIEFRYRTICFFHQPTYPDCFIVGIMNGKDGKSVEIGVLKRNNGDNKWSNKWSKYTYLNKTRFYVSNCNPALHHGQLYYLDVDGNVATFDINKHGSETSWSVHIKCISRLRDKIRQHFLVKFQDILFAVLLAHEERKVFVFKLLESKKMKWEVVTDLVDKMFYVSRTACLAHIVDPLNIMTNRIYFSKYYKDGDKDDDGVFYCLKTRKYHSLKGRYSNKKGYHLRDREFATWIIPTPSEEFSKDFSWGLEV